MYIYTRGRGVSNPRYRWAAQQGRIKYPSVQVSVPTVGRIPTSPISSGFYYYYLGF